jgi:hypothetical protein
MNVKYALILIGIIAIIGISIYFWKPKIKETWFSRDQIYGKANKILMTRYLKKGVKGIIKENADIKNTYKYRGSGEYTGMMCRKPNNIGCTTYSNYSI